LLPQSYTSAIWLVSPDVVTELLNIFLNFGAATTGVTPPPQWLDLNARTLLGRPFYATEHVPKLGTAGDVALVDPSFYVIGDRLTASVVGSPHAAFSTDKTVFRLVHRVDGRPWLGTAVTPKNGSQTVSPIVTLN
jgi:hypothetical protein